MSTITIDLPDTLYQNIERIAKTTGQSLEAILRRSALQMLPPLDDLPPEEAEELAALSLLDDSTLWQVANSSLSDLEQAEMDELAGVQTERTLSRTEAHRLKVLLNKYGQHTVRKAHAYYLLARRGYRVPVQGIDRHQP